MSNFIKRNLADKDPKRGSKIESLLEGFKRKAELDASRGGLREGAREEQETAPRGLPPGFGFRRRTNHH